MTGVRFMVASPPAHEPVNRAVYRVLVEKHGVSVHLVVPRRLYVGQEWRTTSCESDLPFELSVLDAKGRHGRLTRWKGLRQLVKSWKPTHLLIDNDPGSLLVRQGVAAAADSGGVELWSMTAENLMPQYGRDLESGLRSLKPTQIIGPFLTWALRKWNHPRMDRVFTLSSAGESVMSKLGIKCVTRIPLGFDPALFFVHSLERIAATRERLGLTEPTVAYFGRLTPEKGVHLLLEALAGMKDRPWQVLLDRFTDYQSSYTQDLKELVESLELGDRVVFFDAAHDEMADYMNAADVVVLPSVSIPKWKEQYGRVIQEVMACGTPMIASNCGAIPEIMGGHGTVFREGHVTDLRGRIEDVMDTDEAERKAMVGAAAEYARRNLSVDRQAEIFAECLASGSDAR